MSSDKNNLLKDSIKILNELLLEFNSNDSTKFTEFHEKINDKINELYHLYYNKLNIKIVFRDKLEENQFIKSKNDFIIRLNVIKKNLINLKEKLYPWPWNEIHNKVLDIPTSKKNMEFNEIDYATKLSINLFHQINFKN